MKSARDEEVIEKIRQDILDAALCIIVEEGFHSFTMRRLATATKMTAPNIYNYFSSKDEIYINIVIRGFKMLRDLIGKAYSESNDPFNRVRRIAEQYIEFGMTNPRYYEIMFVSATPKYSDYIGTSFEAISEIEYKISMEIVKIVLKSASDLALNTSQKNDHSNKIKMVPEIAERRMIQLWSMLHGMICLNNSKIIPYVVDDHKKVYSAILDDALNSLFAELL